MNIRRIAVFAGTAVVVATFALVVRPLARHVTGLGGELATTARQLASAPESVQDAAVQQRFRMRRTAIAAMHADLLKKVAAESAFFADSGYFTDALPRAYWFEPGRGNMFEAVRLTRHGWWTTIYNVNLSIACAVAVGGDTTIGDAPQGQPACFDGGPLGPAPTTREACRAKDYFQWDQEHGVCRRATL